MIVGSGVLALENAAQLCYKVAVHTPHQQWGRFLVPHPPAVDIVMYIEFSSPKKCGVILHDFHSMFPSSVQFSSVAQSCPKTLCNPMDCSTPGFPVHHQLLKLTQTHVHRVGDAIQPSHPLSSPFPPAFNLSQHQGLLQWVSFLHQMAKVLELHHQSFQRVFRTDFH